MKSRQIMFFLILEDIELSIKSIETEVDIRYYKTGLMDDRTVPSYISIFNAPDIGYTLHGDWNRIDDYLVMQKETSLNIRKIPQKTGETKFAVDQLLNPKSIELKLGGILKEKDNVIVAGRVATVSEDEVSNKLFKLFSFKIKNEFKKIGSFYIGKKAEEKLKLGWRLVTNEKLPREYDLALN
jgi:hypothetical protein